MNSFWCSIALSLIIAVVIFVPLRRKWCIYQAVTWYCLMLGAGIINGIVSWVILQYTGINSFFVYLLNIPVVILEVPLSILPFFYRDPERPIPMEQNVIVSPADGKIIYIKKIEAGEVPLADKKGSRIHLSELTGTPLLSQGSFLIGICMNFLDVHINRAPIAGNVTKVVHIPGQFMSLRHPEGVIKNERQTVVFEEEKISVGIVQIASRLVRRIVSFVHVDEKVELGQRIGAIRFGSQVDVILPQSPSVIIKVKVGDVVRAGVTPLGYVNLEEEYAVPPFPRRHL